jgi:hypothetical protein
MNGTKDISFQKAPAVMAIFGTLSSILAGKILVCSPHRFLNKNRDIYVRRIFDTFVQYSLT